MATRNEELIECKAWRRETIQNVFRAPCLHLSALSFKIMIYSHRFPESHDQLEFHKDLRLEVTGKKKEPFSPPLSPPSTSIDTNPCPKKILVMPRTYGHLWIIKVSMDTWSSKWLDCILCPLPWQRRQGLLIGSHT